MRIATARQGWLLVSDPQRGGVFRVDPTTLVPDQFLDIGGRALSVGVYGKTVLIGNETDYTIDAYDHKGRYDFTFAATVGRPLDIAVDERARLVFVVDAAVPDVKVFDADGILVSTIGGTGSSEPLHLATGIAVDPTRQEVLVAEYPMNPASPANASIKIFDYHGVFLAEISPGGCSWFGGGSGGFSRPQGIAVDGNGLIYVVDAFLAQIFIYDRATLEQVGSIGGNDAGPPHLRIPLDLVVVPRHRWTGCGLHQ